MTEQEFRKQAKENGYPDDWIEDSVELVAESKRDGINIDFKDIPIPQIIIEEGFFPDPENEA